MRKFLVFLIVLPGMLSLAWGQLQISTQEVDFGTVDELTPKTIKVGITNAANVPVTLTDLRVYERFNRTAFTVSPTNLTLAAGATDSLSLTFSPQHNVQYNSEVMLVSDGPEGSYSIDVKGQGHYSNSYYLLTENSSEEDLKQAFQTLLSFGHVQLGYNAGRTEMFMVVDNKKVNGQGTAQNQIECVYTGQEVIGYTSRNDAQNQGFNTEHTFPQSLFGSQEPMLSDLHHLFPVEANSNSQRSNKPFGVVSNPSWQVGGSKSNGSTFEPRDAHKGAAARAMIYFLLRYGDYGNFFASQENILVQWHNSFPPDVIQQRRNDDVYAAQGNRNPFVDYPQFIERIQNLVGFSSAPISHAVDLSANQIDFGTLNWGPSHSNQKVYTIILVNHGNILESLSDFQSNVPGVSFAVPHGDTTLLPGEALPIKVVFSPQDSLPVNGIISFRTSAPGLDSVGIPVTGAVNYLPPPFVSEPGERTLPGSDGGLDSIPGPVIFPNPGNDLLTVLDRNLEGSEGTVLIFNGAGQKLLTASGIFENAELSLSVASLPESIYIVEVRSGEYRKHFRLWVKR